MSGPVGLITMYASTMIDAATSALEPPEGWLICDGRSYLKSDYNALYRNLLRNPALPFNATTNPLIYGGTDTAFNVPNFINKFVRGWATQEPVIQVGEEVKESVTLKNISTDINPANLTYGSNVPYSITNSSVSSAGRHNHRYAQGSATDTGRAELSRTQGFFHGKNFEVNGETGPNYWSHLTPYNHGGATNEPCSLSFGVERMWSIAQAQGNNLILEYAREGVTPVGFSFNPSDNYKPFRSVELFGGGGYPYSIPSEFPEDQRWKWGNRNFRHNHKYNLQVQNDGGHTHSIPMSTNDSHIHTVTTNPTLVKVPTASSKFGGELRPANVKIVYIIYTGVK